MGLVGARFDILLMRLDPASAGATHKTQPCVVISPDELNLHLATLLVAPMTTRGKTYRSRVACRFEGKNGHIALDQIRTLDKTRIVKVLGRLDETTQAVLLQTLAELFAT